MNLFRRRKREDENDERGAAAPEAPPKQPDADRSAVARTEESSVNEPEATPAESTREAHAPPADAPRPAASEAHPMPGSRSVDELRDDVIAVLKTVYDPEIPVDIYELGLIYDVDVEPTGDVEITMTLTTPMCPVAETLPPEVEAKVRDVPGVTHVQLELVWEPPWSMDMMSEAARLELNL